MAADMHISDKEDIELKCDTHNNDLLPLFCKDCNCHLCSDCVINDHAGHNFCKVSEVVEFHKLEIQSILRCDTSLLSLERRLNRLQGEQKCLAAHTESLLRNVLDREEEIIERVKIWRQNMIEKITSLKEDREVQLRKDQIIISALLQHNEKSQHTEQDRPGLELSYLCFQAKRLLTAEPCMTSDEDISDLYEFYIGPSGDDLYDIYGTFRYGLHEELSSDSIPFNSDKEEEEEEFYDCEDLSRRYQICNKPIRNIVPLDSLRFFLLSSCKVYLCAFHGSKIDMKVILSDVQQIALIPSTGDILSIMRDRKQIKRISNKSITTTFLFTTNKYENIDYVSSGGVQAYACVLYKWTHLYMRNDDPWYLNIHLLNEFGVILKTFSYGRVLSTYDMRLSKTNEKNKFYISTNNKIDIFDGESCKCTATYCGAVGKDPQSRFHSCDMITDGNNNVLLAVQNDHAIHLLDTSLRFQRLLLTEEDGLRSPSSIALDTSGYLWVGCEDGQIHVVNYQYLLMTDRLARLKSKR